MQTDDFRIVKGRCITCGYLSKLAYSSGRVYELARSDRFSGNTFKHPSPTGDVITMPNCLRGIDFWEPAEGIYDFKRRPIKSEEAAATAFQRDRGCLKWYPHREGLSPQAHLEEQRAFEFEERREAFELKMEQDRRHFELELANRLEQSEERRHSMMRWVALVGAALVLVEILAVVLGAGPGSLLGDWLSR